MTILYLDFTEGHHTIDRVYLTGLQENGVKVFDYAIAQRGLKRYQLLLRYFFQHRKLVDIIIVGYASPQAVVILRFLTRKKIIYNAVSSEFERMVVSRQLVSPGSLKGVYYWLQDFLAVHLANLVMLESNHQISYFSRLFKIRPKSTFLAWTGVDSHQFKYRPNLGKFEAFTVVFRGRLLPEAGGELVVSAAQKLAGAGVTFIMLAAGMELKKVQAEIDKFKLSNLRLITEHQTIEKMVETMQRSHLSLGQLADHPRLERTIPHKAFESLALKLPYLTGNNAGVLELLQDGETCLTFEAGNVDDLVKKIRWAKENPAALQKIAENGYRLYFEKLGEKTLAAALIQRLAKRRR